MTPRPIAPSRKGESSMIRSNSKKLLLTLGAAGALLSSGTARASSHREAPLITEDPTVDATDLYAFLSPDGPAPGSGATVTLIANYSPSEPAGPPNYYRFSDTALYEIKIDNTGDAIEDIVFQIQFAT